MSRVAEFLEAKVSEDCNFEKDWLKLLKITKDGYGEILRNTHLLFCYSPERLVEDRASNNRLAMVGFTDLATDDG